MSSRLAGVSMVLTLATVAASLATGGETAIITNIPHVAQRPDFCGEACVEMVLRARGHTADQDAVFDMSGADPALGRGCVTRELRDAMTAVGLKPGNTWHQVKAADTNAIAGLWRSLVCDLTAGIPSVVCMRTSEQPGASEHFRLVVGYDDSAAEVVYHEPSESNGAFRRMKLGQFLFLWPLKYRADQWTVIRLRCEVGKLVPFVRPDGRLRAEFAQHVRKLKQRLPEGTFTIVVQPPFVVIGDESAARVRFRAENTVGWAVSQLKKDFFTADPGKILNVWLFGDKKSYEENCRDLLGEEPTTPFGFCSGKTGDLIMNIATGGGTLVHEIVHPYMQANFPDYPAWLNEGMGSLYEQSGERDGHIVGFTNWRLEGLQQAIRKGKMQSFKELTGMTSHQFYSEDRGTNYAQARYLCYYLQEKGLLVKFYKAFLEAREADPTGYKTLQTTLGEKEMDAFQRKWEKFVLGLTFP